jgi:hypothetical protein
MMFATVLSLMPRLSEALSLFNQSERTPQLVRCLLLFVFDEDTHAYENQLLGRRIVRVSCIGVRRIHCTAG